MVEPAQAEVLASNRTSLRGAMFEVANTSCGVEGWLTWASLLSAMVG